MTMSVAGDTPRPAWFCLLYEPLDVLASGDVPADAPLRFVCSAVHCVAVHAMRLRDRVDHTGHCPTCEAEGRPACGIKARRLRRHIAPEVHEALRTTLLGGFPLCPSRICAAFPSEDPPTVCLWIRVYPKSRHIHAARPPPGRSVPLPWGPRTQGWWLDVLRTHHHTGEPAVPPDHSGRPHDLVEAVAPHPEARRETFERLLGLFVAHPRLSAVLRAPIDVRNPHAMPTYLDTDRDPIVPVLRAWVSQSVRATGPSSSVPPELAPISPDIWPQLIVAGGRRLLIACGGAVGAYLAGGRDARALRPARAPAPEVLHAWRRLTDGGVDTLPFCRILDTLRWDRLVPEDETLLRMLTGCLLRHGGRELEAWHDGPGWHWRVCMPSLRVAALFVGRVRAGGKDPAGLIARVAGALLRDDES